MIIFTKITIFIKLFAKLVIESSVPFYIDAIRWKNMNLRNIKICASTNEIEHFIFTSNESSVFFFFLIFAGHELWGGGGVYNLKQGNFIFKG